MKDYSKVGIFCILFVSLAAQARFGSGNTLLALGAQSAERAVLLRDIGVIGLASHDLFTWDRQREVNTENGRLDLSTIFDFADGTRWKKGGNRKNSENAPVYTITTILVRFYKDRLKSGTDPMTARKETVLLFHSMVRDSFPRLTGRSFPARGIDAPVTNVEQAAMRAMHDILPGQIKLFDRKQNTLDVTDIFKAKTFLSEAELNQPIPFFNGDYDLEYTHIKIPFKKDPINLKEVDGRFIEKFSPYRQSELLAQLAAVGSGQISRNQVQFIDHLVELFSKGICPLGNPWMPDYVECE